MTVEVETSGSRFLGTWRWDRDSVGHCFVSLWREREEREFVCCVEMGEAIDLGGCKE